MKKKENISNCRVSWKYRLFFVGIIVVISLDFYLSSIGW